MYTKKVMDVSTFLSNLSLDDKRLALLLLQEFQNDEEKNEELSTAEADNSVENDAVFSNAEDNSVYYVSKILNHKWQDGKIYYKLEWKDKTETLEPEENLINCDKALFKYIKDLAENNSVIIIYTRSSKFNPNMEGHISLDMQRKECLAFCKKNKRFNHNNIFII